MLISQTEVATGFLGSQLGGACLSERAAGCHSRSNCISQPRLARSDEPCPIYGFLGGQMPHQTSEGWAKGLPVSGCRNISSRPGCP